ncbi:unnamed protein product [Medioppia subpectinata]|uniref:Uncharacterized protein n=1 Tax=Medioppia subpectinata TaxID=1979941 RepID=A0A7R9QE79_9ACAR|nr:unnamed protein product [Medioppia subpectinata]CAG2119283.1 unnamed protein product [Medioppia subpectinata]
MSAYIMSKTALDMFTKCMAAELGPKGIRVNSVDPGAIKTKMPQAFYDNYAKLYPVGRYGEGSDIAHAVLYLASDESSFITGTALVADGGHLVSAAI